MTSNAKETPALAPQTTPVAKAIIPEIIIKCLLGQDIVTTPGEQTREFNYVDNIINGLLMISSKIDNYEN